MAKEDDELPDNLRSMMEHIHFFAPEESDPAMLEIIRRGAEGRCMLCTKELGKNTLLLIGADGIRMVFCSGACLSDQQVMGWMEEVHDDMAQAIKFRGTDEGDQPPVEGDPSDPREE